MFHGALPSAYMHLSCAPATAMPKLSPQLTLGTLERYSMQVPALVSTFGRSGQDRFAGAAPTVGICFDHRFKILNRRHNRTPMLDGSSMGVVICNEVECGDQVVLRGSSASRRPSPM